MKAKDVLDEIRAVLKQTKDDGHSNVSVDALQNYLIQFDKDVESDTYYKSLNQEAKLAEFKAQNDRSIAHATNLTAHSLEMFKSVITAGQSALKASMVINGGAAVALLAFTGKIWETSTTAVVVNSLTNSILLFCLGVLCAALATGTTYLTQSIYAKDKITLGNAFNFFNIFVVLASYVLFGVGSFIAADSLGVHFGL